MLNCLQLNKLQSASIRNRYVTQKQVIKVIHSINNALSAILSLPTPDKLQIEKLQRQKDQKMEELRQKQRNVKNNIVYRRKERETLQTLKSENNINIIRAKRRRKRIVGMP